MRLITIIGCLLLSTAAATAQKCDALLDSAYNTKAKYVSGPSVVYQTNKIYGTDGSGKTNYLWLRRDFESGPTIMFGDRYGALPVKLKNYTFLYGELMHDSTLRDFGTGRQYHGKATFTFTNGDSITVQTYPMVPDRFYPEQQNISFVILLNNSWPVPNNEMRKTFGLRKRMVPGETALRDKLKTHLLREVRYTQSYAERNEQGVAELHYGSPVITTYTEEEAKRLQQAAGCLTGKVIDRRFP